MLAETKLWEAFHQVTLTAFEAATNRSTRPRILTFMALTSCLAKTAARPTSNSFSIAACAWVVPQVVCGEWEQLLRLCLMFRQAVVRCVEAAVLGRRNSASHHHLSHH